MGGELVFILVVLFSIIRGLYLFFRWVVRGVTRLGAPGPTFTPQAMPPQGPVPQPRLPLQSQRPSAPQYPEATTASFRVEEEQLIRSEPQSAFALPQNDVPAASPSDAPLFDASRDFLRAFILQEALGPPLSRRQRH